MQVLVIVLLVAAIIALAVFIIFRTFRKVKTGGKCAACDYDCELKKIKDKHDHLMAK